MKKFLKLLSSLFTALLISILLVSCQTDDIKDDSSNQSTNQSINQGEQTSGGNSEEGGGTGTGESSENDGEVHDYAGEVTLDLTGTTSIVQEVTVKSYVDGDTTHFYVPESTTFPAGYLKARYLSVNTPESTGKIEEWGKAASKFTKEKLSTASSIYIESDDLNWNVDSTGGRYLLWIWYKPQGSATYRCLNIELLQEGLAIASNSANNKYGTICSKAIAQAKKNKLKIYSDELDPDFYYGTAVQVNLQELRCHITEYVGQDVAVTGNVVRVYNEGVYLEDYYENTDSYSGMYVYYGYSAAPGLLQMLKAGSRVTLVGSVQLYETAGTYQISGLIYNEYDPGEDNCSLIEKDSSKYGASYTEVTPEKYNSTVTVSFEKTTTDSETLEETVDIETLNIKYSELILNTSITMKDLRVVYVYTTDNDPTSSSYGAMTLTCKCGDETIIIRTAKKLFDSESEILYKTIDIKGFVDYFSGSYQIKVFSASHITIH